jgi:lactoylglutathione lyase
MFKRIDHTAISVSDINTSVSFYKQHFGFEVYFEHTTPNSGIKIVYLKLGDTVLELLAATPKKSMGFHFALETTNLKLAMTHLVSNGVKINRELHDTPARNPMEHNWKRIEFLGPDGEIIEIRGPY